MADEPSYPEDAPVGDPAPTPPAPPRRESEASNAAAAAAAAKGGESHRTRNIVAGAAIGIGSAAIVAALLYANRSKKSGDKGGNG